jgi:hypothetical protein
MKRSIIKNRQLNARSAFRLDHARQLEAEIMLLGFVTAPSYGIEI